MYVHHVHVHVHVYIRCMCRQLCVYVDAHAVYCTLAEILYADDNLTFASLMVQVLNQILFTSTELYGLRLQLQLLETPVGVVWWGWSGCVIITIIIWCGLRLPHVIKES